MSAISFFEEKQVRRAWNPSEEKWYFSIDDVVLALTDSANVKDYIMKLRKRDPALDSYWGTNCPPLEMIAPDEKKRTIKAANTESLRRIIQSIPSPKAEPFKRWLAAVGCKRLEEIENPELAARPNKNTVLSGETPISKDHPESRFPLVRFSAKRTSRPIRKLHSFKPSTTSSFHSRIPSWPLSPMARQSRCEIPRALLPSSFHQLSTVHQDPAVSLKESSASHRASTIQIQKSKRFSTASLNSLARSYHRARRIAARGGLDFLPIKGLGQSFNS